MYQSNWPSVFCILKLNQQQSDSIKKKITNMSTKEWASISNHQENTNQTHKEISPQSICIAIIKKAKSNK
jgi:hypothetical protein